MLRFALPTLDDATQDSVAARVHGAVLAPRSSAQAVLWLAETQRSESRDHVTSSDLLETICTDLRLGRAACVAGTLVPDAGVLDDLVQAARKGETELSIVNPELHRPSRLLVTQQIASGTLGSVGLVRIHAWDPLDAAAHDADVGAMPQPLRGDATREAARGAAFRLPRRLLDAIDTVLRLVDSIPKVVATTANFDVESIAPNEPGDNLLVQIGYSSGAMALIDWAQLPAGASAYDSLSVIAAHGAAYADDESNYQHCLQSGGVRAWRADEQLRTLVNLAQLVATTFGDAHATSASVAHWRRTLTTVAEIERSLAACDAVGEEGM